MPYPCNHPFLIRVKRTLSELTHFYDESLCSGLLSFGQICSLIPSHSVMQHIRNTIQLIGRLGQDPLRRTFDSGSQLTTFSLATSETYTKSSGDRVTDTQWHQVVVWGKLADIAAEYLTKGREVVVSGKLVYRQYEDKQGNTRTKAEIHASSLLLLGQKAVSS